MYLIYIGTVVTIPICYVCSLYIFDRHQHHPDHPLTIKKRLWGVYLSTALICTWTYYLLGQSNDDPAHLMGFFIDQNTFWDILRAVGLTSTIYLGTFLMDILDNSARFHLTIRSISSYCFLRNVIVAPLTEELVYRSCLAVLLRLCTSENIALYLGPMLFSISHYHHIRSDIKHGYTLPEAIINRSIQAAYTYVFGVYSTYLFFRTSNLFPSIFAHSFCNHMELPRVFDVGSTSFKNTKSLIYLTHLAGLCLFIYFLPSL